MKREEAINKINHLSSGSEPFIFIIDYEMNNCIVEKTSDAEEAGILFDFNGFKNAKLRTQQIHNLKFKPNFTNYKQYLKAFEIVQDNILKGNSYLVNLTFETPIKTNLTLEQIFYSSKAKYKLLLKNRFVVFSPESFVKINKNEIFTYPMKGTIDASLPRAEQQLLSNKKEFAEHVTIVDLLRNDLSMNAHNVKVDKFRYIDTVYSRQKELLQVSSQIKGALDSGYEDKLGNIIFDMLPAGSVTGAPKTKTCEIIQEAENYSRGYYTGIAAYFDGEKLDSCVLIRFIEQKANGQMVYKSGGGITSLSNPKDEYNELNHKIYVPID